MEKMLIYKKNEEVFYSYRKECCFKVFKESTVFRCLTLVPISQVVINKHDI